MKRIIVIPAAVAALCVLPGHGTAWSVDAANCPGGTGSLFGAHNLRGNRRAGRGFRSDWRSCL